MRCAKFGVAVLKVFMLDWGVLICHGYMCIVLYMKLIWCNGFAEISARSAMRGAKCGVAVLKGIYALLEGGVNVPWVYVHCAIYETYLV